MRRWGTAKATRRARRRLALAVLGLGALVAWAREPRAPAAVAVPASAGAIVERLPAETEGARERELRGLRAALARRPEDVALAVRVAERAIELGRARSDPRYLGQAEAALAPLLARPEPPLDALTLRATLRQSQHDFPGALHDLGRVLRARPRDPQARLTRAVVLTVLARYAEAREDCRALAGLAPAVIAAACVETLEGLTGHAREAHARLAQLAARERAPSAAERAFVESTLGELAARAGLVEVARGHLERALAADPGDAYALAALADLDLDQGRAGDVLRRLEGREAHDQLLLRLALAAAAARDPRAAALSRELGARFDASRLRGDVVHRREEARYRLWLAADPTGALELAARNWEVQREVADARVLLEAAIAARAPARAAPALAWLRESRCEDPTLARLARALE